MPMMQPFRYCEAREEQPWIGAVPCVRAIDYGLARSASSISREIGRDARLSGMQSDDGCATVRQAVRMAGMLPPNARPALTGMQCRCPVGRRRKLLLASNATAPGTYSSEFRPRQSTSRSAPFLVANCGACWVIGPIPTFTAGGKTGYPLSLERRYPT